MVTRGSYVYITTQIYYMVETSGASRKCKFDAIISENWWFSDNNKTQGFYNAYNNKKITIYQNYILALNNDFNQWCTVR